MTPLWISLATSAVMVGQPDPAELSSPPPPLVEVLEHRGETPATIEPLVANEPSWEETLSGAGRVWTDEGMDRIAPSSMGRAQRILGFTPGAHVDASGQLWLSGSRVHTIYLDGVAIDVERVIR